jgi:hypothetical protein
MCSWRGGAFGNDTHQPSFGGFGRRQLGNFPAVAHHRDTIAAAKNFFELR